ncbi:tetratricopeptide repeat protein [Terrimonas sp. NA20]|uniref:Tetratricopeptide repeat protein n=1 Tax=Terrimonas ginsenosidimutans TaxID=2908004 RepID=A0ABS9KL90_9BACT|nr:tetratricopeptide repeat protein [Terrimonas ginsenosidimutans]MCG2613090.1 tetratricopeptide repeat protein [Terrimonas ginsenosidimutans]
MKSFLVACLFSLQAFVTSAQSDSEWTAVMTQSSLGQSYNDFKTLPELETYIREQAQKSRVISEVVYARGRWHAVATETAVKTNIRWKWDEAFPQSWIKQQWDDDKYITKLTYGDDQWLAIMTDQTPFVSQSWASRETWEEVIEFARGKWKEDTKFNITDIAYGDGKWYIVMSLLKTYEAQSFKHSEDFPTDWINEKYKDNYNITSVEHDGFEWHLIMTKHTSLLSETIFNPQKDFPSAKIKEQWDKNRRISTLAFSRDMYEMDDFERLQLFGNRENLDKNLRTNREKAQEQLNEKNYPEAIRLYKVAVADGNTDETTYNNLSWAQFLNGNCNEALENANKSINVKSTSFNNHTKGSILKCQNKCAEALKFYDEAIRLYRKEREKFTTSDYYADRAAVKRCLGNYIGAIEDIELALSIQPGDNTLKATLKELNTLAGNK